MDALIKVGRLDEVKPPHSSLERSEAKFETILNFTWTLIPGRHPVIRIGRVRA